jgi:plastocyanin
VRALGRIGLVTAAASVVALLPAAAQAASTRVLLGPPGKAEAQLNKQYLADVNDFFPHGVTIGVGDRVVFVPVGFHSVDLPATGSDPEPLIGPTGKKVAGARDAAGQPFWFNGQDELSLNANLVSTRFGKSLTYDGSKAVRSGVPLGAKLKPMTVTFKKAGKFTYYCNVHAGMKGTVTVKGGASARSSAKAIARQVARARKVAKRIAKTIVPAGVVDVGAAGPHGVEYYGMLPAKATVKAGSALRFRMSPGSFDIHTASFGPGDPEKQPKSYLGALAGSFQGAGAPNPAVTYPSEAPGVTATHSPALHGNGFWSTGLMDNGNGTSLPASNTLTFGTPGTYDFYCLFHPFMHGQVVVAP